MIVVKVSMVIQRGKRDQAVRLLRERDRMLEAEGVPKAARMYLRKLASAGAPEIIREYEFKNFDAFEKAWAVRMLLTT